MRARGGSKVPASCKNVAARAALDETCSESAVRIVHTDYSHGGFRNRFWLGKLQYEKTKAAVSAAGPAAERRLKEDEVRVASTPAGLPARLGRSLAYILLFIC